MARAKGTSNGGNLETTDFRYRRCQRKGVPLRRGQS